MTALDTALLQARIEGRVYDRPRQAVILAGGRGERMRPITDDRPKPMAPILGRPFLEYQIEQLRDQGFERVLILLGYLPDVVQNHFGDGRRWGVRIDYSVTAPEQLTSSRVAAARGLIDPCFLLLYCDNYWPMQMSRLWARFRQAGKPALITVYSNKDAYSKGCARLDENQDVRVFDRRRAAPSLREVEISYAIVTDLALSLLPDEDTLFEEAIYTPLAEQRRLAAYVSDHRYYSIGSLDRLPTTEAFFRREPTVILDRDGVLNRKPPQAQYVRDWSEWEWLPGSLEALRLLREANWRTIIASNQPGIGRGVMSEADLEALHSRMKQEIAEAGGRNRRDLLLSARLGRRLRVPQAETRPSLPGPARLPPRSHAHAVRRRRRTRRSRGGRGGLSLPPRERYALAHRHRAAAHPDERRDRPCLTTSAS